jgi:hypothetical protein
VLAWGCLQHAKKIVLARRGIILGASPQMLALRLNQPNRCTHEIRLHGGLTAELRFPLKSSAIVAWLPEANAGTITGALDGNWAFQNGRSSKQSIEGFGDDDAAFQ